MFNETNTIEEMLIAAAVGQGWENRNAAELERSTSSVLLETVLQDALLRLNPITRDQAGQVINSLRTVIIGARPDDLVTRNQQLRKMLFEENSYPFGKDGEHIAIRFFSDDPYEDSRIVTNQWEFPKPSINGGKRLDIVFLINGIPLVIGETKTPVRPAVTWADGAEDILLYQKSIPEMFVTNVLCFATEGKDFYYGGIGAPIQKWGPWYCDEERRHGTLADVQINFSHLMKPEKIVDIYRYFTVFTTNPDTHKKMKVVCRYQQYEGGNAIVERVREGKTKRGLIWHFQGSGKSWLMVFAAQKLRNMPELHNPTVVIVDDRVDLEDQITGDFTRAEIPNLFSATSKEKLEEFFRGDQRKIMITTIFKFGDVSTVLSERDNIIVMVDEAHRTQERELGVKMRNALPNAYFFGLTGTPINKRETNTFATFGTDVDESGYMSRYSFQNSIDDGATLELSFKPVPVELKLDEKALQGAFDEMTDMISEEEKGKLVQKTSIEAFFTAPSRINRVCNFIVRHFREYVEPTGLKAQVVVYNRACCVAYKKALDTLLGTTDQTTIVMHTGDDKGGEFQQWRRSRDEEKQLLDRFRDPLSPLKFVIVTSKLLTGFDAPILQCMYLDKPMKDHTLLQAICRTNRKYDSRKQFGLVVDFVGVFDNVAKSLNFDEKSVKTVIRNIQEIKNLIPKFMQECLDFFPNVDRQVGGFEGLAAAQQCLYTADLRDRFAQHYMRLHKAWEAVSPDECLREFQSDYIWLGQVYESIKPIGTEGSLIWKVLGPKTIELIHQNVQTIDIGEDLEELVLNSEVINSVLDVAKAGGEVIKIEKMLELRLGKHKGDPTFQRFSEKLRALKDRMHENLITSIEFLKELLQMAKEVLEEEKKQNQPVDKRQKAKAALTELFESIRSKDTPIAVEAVVNDIDTQVVAIVRKFSDTFATLAGQNEVKRQLRSILWIKYKIKDNEVFEKAYKYIEMYY